jgi:hypothetical protein
VRAAALVTAGALANHRIIKWLITGLFLTASSIPAAGSRVQFGRGLLRGINGLVTAGRR